MFNKTNLKNHNSIKNNDGYINNNIEENNDGHINNNVIENNNDINIKKSNIENFTNVNNNTKGRDETYEKKRKTIDKLDLNLLKKYGMVILGILLLIIFIFKLDIINTGKSKNDDYIVNKRDQIINDNINLFGEKNNINSFGENGEKDNISSFEKNGEKDNINSFEKNGKKNELSSKKLKVNQKKITKLGKNIETQGKIIPIEGKINIKQNNREIKIQNGKFSIFGKQKDLLKKLYPNLKKYVPVRVLLKRIKPMENYNFYSQNGMYTIINGKQLEVERVSIKKDNGLFLFSFIDKNGKNIIMKKDRIHLIAKNKEIPIELEGIQLPKYIKINNMEMKDISNLNDNKFGIGIDMFIKNNNIYIVNELDIEDYILGIGEMTKLEPIEKQKAIAILARSYVYFYQYQNKIQKFPGKEWNASDQASEFQKYIGFSFKKRNDMWEKAVKETEGLILKRFGNPLLTAYSSCSNTSDGKRKTLKEANWNKGYKRENYFKYVESVYQKVDDSFGKGTNCGHGVGLSGKGSKYLAEVKGYNYKQILNYYYKGIKISKLR